MDINNSFQFPSDESTSDNPFFSESSEISEESSSWMLTNSSEFSHPFSQQSINDEDAVINEFSDSQNLLFESTMKDSCSKEEILERIENIMQDIVKNIAEEKTPVLFLRNQRDWNNCTFEDDIVCLKPSSEAQLVEIKFSSPRSRPKMAIILHLLAKIYRLIKTASTCTKRELYYQNVGIIQNQSVIDSALRDICVLLEVPLWQLGVTSTSKGLIAGHLQIITADNQTIDCRTSNGILLPHDINGIQNITTNAKFILVIEKDATFQKLLDENVLELLGPCILITGKGFPDVNTRLMIKRLWQDFSLPIFGLFDADPHGIEIMCTYRFGSLAMSHQSDGLAVPSMAWIGVLPSDISRLNIPTLPMHSEDVQKLQDLLERPYIKNNPKIIKEINILMKIRKKAEIEGVGALSNSYLTDNYLPVKINTTDFI